MASPDEMMAAVARSLPERTGRSLNEWVALVRASGVDPLDQNAVRRWLKAEHDLPQNSQWAIADATARAAGWTPPTVEEYIAQQYTGTKAALRPVFDGLRAVLETFGDDISVEGRGTYTPFVRHRQFVAIAPGTATRLDVGLRYTDPPASPLLTPASAPGQATHRLSLGSLEDVTPDVERLLRTAYDQN